jgi:hypothetical protein
MPPQESQAEHLQPHRTHPPSSQHEQGSQQVRTIGPKVGPYDEIHQWGSKMLPLIFSGSGILKWWIDASSFAVHYYTQT